MNTNKIKELIEANEFDQVAKLLSEKQEKEIESILITIAYEHECLLVYTFINAMIQQKETTSWHYLGAFIMAMAFNHLKYGYQIAFYHTKKAIELSPNNMELKAFALLFYSIPEKLLDRNTALEYAKELYDYDKNSNVARHMLGLPLIT